MIYQTLKEAADKASMCNVVRIPLSGDFLSNEETFLEIDFNGETFDIHKYNKKKNGVYATFLGSNKNLNLEEAYKYVNQEVYGDVSQHNPA